MDTSQYTAPPVPTSIDAITITQTLTHLGSPYTITFTTLATVTLSKFLPTPTQDSQTQDQSGLSPSTIGTIVGSILGLIVLLALVYFCCARGGDDEPPEDDPDPYPHPGRAKGEVPGPSPVRIEQRGDTIVESRPRRNHKAPMDTARVYTRKRTHLEYETYE